VIGRKRNDKSEYAKVDGTRLNPSAGASMGRPQFEGKMTKTPKHQTDEVPRILAVWRDLGIKDLDGRRARAGFEPTGEHLANLRNWRLKSRTRPAFEEIRP